jgi:hypothetical protein
MRERGLKLVIPLSIQVVLRVAPHAGAWIETTKNSTPSTTEKSLPMRERGLKLCPPGAVNLPVESLSLRGREGRSLIIPLRLSCRCRIFSE